MMKNKKNVLIDHLEDTTTESAEHLIKDRLPWLFLGLFGGLVVTFVISKYEALLAADVRLAFFIPIIVYLSDAVGTQTETIYIRTLVKKKINFIAYILKETLVGLGLGSIFGVFLGFFATLWLKSVNLGFVVGITILINQTLAPVLAVMIPNLIKRSHSDPALGAGPVATIIQDFISLMIFFLIAMLIMFD